MSRKEKRRLEEEAEKQKKKEKNKAKKEKKQKDRKDGKDKKDKKNKDVNKDNKKIKEKKKSKNIFVRLLKGLLKIILVIFLIIVLLAGILVGWLGFKTGWKKDEMLKLFIKQSVMIVTGQTQEDLDNLKPLYFVAMGVSIDIDVELTDTIIVCAYYPKTQQATMLSIPRDTFVGVSKTRAGGGDKINALYRESPQETLKAINKITGLNIENYVVIRTDGLIKLVDEIGGVDFNVPINMDYDDWSQKLHIHLKQGKQHINGNKAEQLLRFRKNNDGTGYPASYGSDDFGRMRTQREFITETIKETIQLKNVTKLNEIVNIAFKNVETNMNLDEVLKYVPAAVDFNISNIRSEALPGVSDRLGPQDLWFFVHNEEETEKIVKELFTFGNTGNVSVAPSNLNLEVLNASGDEELAGEIIEKLEDKGYNILNTGVTTIAKSTKVINRTSKNKDVTQNLINTIGIGQEKNGQNNNNADYTIIIGQDCL